mgnify:CR=1 FL=1
MAGNDGNDSKNSGCMATGKHDSAGHDPDVQVTFAQNSPDQKNPLMRNPVIAAVIYAIVFAAICVLYTAIGLFTYFAYVILAIPGCILIPFAALLLTRKIRTLWNPLWLAGTAILTYATTLVSSSGGNNAHIIKAYLVDRHHRATDWLIYEWNIVHSLHGRIQHPDHLLHFIPDLPRIRQ